MVGLGTHLTNGTLVRRGVLEHPKHPPKYAPVLPWMVFGAGGMIGPLLMSESLTHMLTKHLYPPLTWSMRVRNAVCMSKECERLREHHLSLSYCQLLEAWANKLLYSTNGLPPYCPRKGKLPIVPRWTGCAARSPSPCYIWLFNAFVELILPHLTVKLTWIMSCLCQTFKINFFTA